MACWTRRALVLQEQLIDTRVDAVITKTLQSVPRGATHWSTRTMVSATGLSQTAVSRIWRAFGSQQHRQETFKLSNDPMLVEKVRDIVGLYMEIRRASTRLTVDTLRSTMAAMRRCTVVLRLPISASTRALAGAR